jgi:hypothetical protein
MPLQGHHRKRSVRSNLVSKIYDALCLKIRRSPFQVAGYSILILFIAAVVFLSVIFAL